MSWFLLLLLLEAFCFEKKFQNLFRAGGAVDSQTFPCSNRLVPPFGIPNKIFYFIHFLNNN